MKFLAAYDRALDEWEIFGQHAAQAPVHFSAYVTLTLSFALPGGTSFKTVNVTGLRHFTALLLPPAFGVVVSPSFLLDLYRCNTAGRSSCSPPINGVISRCCGLCNCLYIRISGFSNAARALTTIFTNISVFDAEERPVITHTNIEFPAIFSVSCSGSRISMSSYYAGATNVTFNLSFIVAATVASVPFKTISVTGLRLLAFNSSTASPKCTNINSSSVVVTANLMMPSGTLLLHFSNAVKLNRGSNEITCSVFGFTNAGAAAATATMSVSTFDAEGLPFQTQLGVEFPVISQQPPVPAGLIALYNAESWTGFCWTDLSTNGRKSVPRSKVFNGTIRVRRRGGARPMNVRPPQHRSMNRGRHRHIMRALLQLVGSRLQALRIQRTSRSNAACVTMYQVPICWKLALILRVLLLLELWLQCV